jgi:hypothetical protein
MVLFFKYLRNSKLIKFLLLSAPILWWLWPYLKTGRNNTYGDYDYYFQLYEAVRVSILKYHQFPWINPWISGGVPLFANPQLGLPSLHFPLILVFGSVLGLKLSFVIYYLLGFWGMRKLLVDVICSSRTIASIISYIWVFNGFFTAHQLGHFTFLLYMLVPGLLYMYVKSRSSIRWNLTWVISTAVFILSSPHYAVIQSLLALSLVIIVDLVVLRNLSIARLKRLAYSLMGLVVLTLWRLVFIAQFVTEWPRDPTTLLREPPILPSVAFKAFIYPLQNTTVALPATPYGWHEVSMFIGTFGVISLLCALIILLKYRRSMSQKERKITLISFLLIPAMFVTALGDFHKFSPFNIIQHLPILSSMRVASRWSIWIIFIGLCLISYSSTRSSFTRKVVTVLVSISLFQVVVSNYNFGNFFIFRAQKFASEGQPFKQVDYAREELIDDSKEAEVKAKESVIGFPLYKEFMYEATLSGYGLVHAADSLVDTRTVPTIRCGSGPSGCPLILTDNATVEYWSPNKIILKRTASGSISLNINPSSYYLVNNVRQFKSSRVVETLEKFEINDPSEKIVIEARPALKLLP